jgi:hypothetical protein
VGFTFKRAPEDSKIKQLVTMFDEIEQAREQKKKDEQRSLTALSERAFQDKTVSAVSSSIQGSTIRTETSLKIGTTASTLIVPKDKIHQLGMQPTSDRGIHHPVIEKIHTQPDIRKPAGNDMKMIYMGPYTKGMIAQRSTSNEPGYFTTITSPKKATLPPSSIPTSNTLSTRKNPPATAALKKPADTAPSLIPMNPSIGAKPKPKGFGFLGMKFMPKNNMN